MCITPHLDALLLHFIVNCRVSDHRCSGIPAGKCLKRHLPIGSRNPDTGNLVRLWGTTTGGLVNPEGELTWNRVPGNLPLPAQVQQIQPDCTRNQPRRKRGSRLLQRSAEAAVYFFSKHEIAGICFSRLDDHCLLMPSSPPSPGRRLGCWTQLTTAGLLFPFRRGEFEVCTTVGLNDWLPITTLLFSTVLAA